MASNLRDTAIRSDPDRPPSRPRLGDAAKIAEPIGWECWPMTEMDEVAIDGVALHNTTTREVLDHVSASLRLGFGGRIATPNLDHLFHARRDAQSRDLLMRAAIRVADGTPLVWISALQGTRLRERIAGADLVWALAHLAADENVPLVLIGGTPESVLDAARRFGEEVPGSVVVAHSPPHGFESDPAQMDRLSQMLGGHTRGVVLCGLGFPKQERVAEALLDRHPGFWFMGCGAAIDMAAGHRRRAPRWIQRSGFEWLYRLAQEPRRLFQRYVLHDLPLALRLLGRAATTRLLAPSMPRRPPGERRAQASGAPEGLTAPAGGDAIS